MSIAHPYAGSAPQTQEAGRQGEGGGGGGVGGERMTPKVDHISQRE